MIKSGQVYARMEFLRSRAYEMRDVGLTSKTK